MASSVVGVDIGTTGIRAVEVQDAGKRAPKLLRLAQVSVPEGAIVRGEVVEQETVAHALRNLWSSGKFTSKAVVLGMGHQNVLARDHQVARMPLNQIRESLPFHVQDLLPVPIADVLLDFYPSGEVMSENGPMIDGLLIAAIKQAVLANVGAVERAKLQPVEVDLIPFALARVGIVRPQLPGMVVMIDFGASYTSVVATTDGVVRFMRMIPAGGNDITEAIRARLEVEPVVAEQLKIAVGLDAQPVTEQQQRAQQIVREQAEELFRNVRNTLNYVVSTTAGAPIAELIISGGGSQLRGLDNAIAGGTGLRVGYPNPFKLVEVTRKVDLGGARETPWAFTVAIGLALGSAA